MCSTLCSAGSHAYYALQGGDECWCGGEGVDIDRFGTGVCDLPCAGDSSFNCGGDLSYRAYEVGTDAAPPTPTPPGPLESCTSTATITYTSPTIFVQGGGCATLSDIYAAQPSDEEAVFVTDESSEALPIGTTPTGFWLVARDIHIIEGSTLYVHGKKSPGGDADILRIQSNSKKDFYEIRGHGGNLFFENTKVTSWDTFLGKEQEKHEGGRSFINCVSEKLGPEKCSGIAKKDMGECRMDIVNSVMGNMGYFDSESYGLTWKVRGFCKDYSNPEVFKRTNVYGDILNSEIYGMYYGHYTFGHQGGVWTNNIMRDNVQYGFDPHDDSDYLTIAYNTVYGNGNHGIIASKRCNNVKIYNNEVYGGGKEAVGIFLHRSSNKCEVYGNYVHDMQDSGMALMESMDADIHDNTFEDVKYGIRLSLGCARNRVYRNTFATCKDYGLYTYLGSDPPEESEDWDGRPRENVFTNNVISNTKRGVKINSADDNIFTYNVFTGTEMLEFEEATDTLWANNSLPLRVCIEGDLDFTSDSDAPGPC
eukprot:g10853.t1